ncbi:hypothetical protein NESM_000184300 [Novymonas esmeraldas]|uniref:Uncharacterized protein n=1 Tax=Novymonas esmeraldas TaxID=1808958 RepID=A0AAW0F3Q8_9TRYP
MRRRGGVGAVTALRLPARLQSSTTRSWGSAATQDTAALLSSSSAAPSAPPLSRSARRARRRRRKAGELADTPPPPRRAAESERDLLRYFGRARRLYDPVPLHSASFTLQRASAQQAQRVPFATLFPTSSPAPPTGGGDAAADLLAGVQLRASQQTDWQYFRHLSPRFSSVADSSKLFGATEVPLQDVCADVAALWKTACAAWEAAMEVVDGAAHHHRCGDPQRLSRHYAMCLVVCFSQTQEKWAVGSSMRRIASQVCGLASAGAAAPQLFATTPMFVGLQGRDGLGGTASASDTVAYPTGGLYTLAALVQCLTRLAPHVLHPRACGSPTSLQGLGDPYTLQPLVFLLSDSWLHTRSVADLFGDDEVSAAPPWRDGVVSFTPAAVRRSVHVVPAVVSDRLSGKEEDAFARFIWCTMQRQVNVRCGA